ncbi:LysR substrate-binding domain-containing protein [Rhodovulum sp. DZ06]|uniref:LysR substrate-binding domain-containing protein n=1 Tax=Rhodovulum sp. DZ06 TaxID=3425126 RepID=UPI003D3425A7
MDASDLHRTLTIRHIRVIAALAELKLVARVAEELNVTQPAVSKQIAELQRIVGAPIVTRDRNRLHLTPIGLRLAEHARQVLNQIDRAAFDIEAMASGVTGAVSVGIVASVAPTIMPDALALLKRSAPQTSVAIVEGHFNALFPQLESGMTDLLIARVWQAQDLPGIEQTALFSEPVAVVAGRDHPLAAAGPLDWAQAADQPWIFPQANSVARRAIDALFAEHGLATPTDIIASASLTLNLGIMRKMPALGLFPEGLANAHAARGDIVVLPLDTRGLLSEVRCFWRAGAQEANSALALLLRCLEQTAAPG